MWRVQSSSPAKTLLLCYGIERRDVSWTKICKWTPFLLGSLNRMMSALYLINLSLMNILYLF